MENFFTDRELSCKCCGELIIDHLFLERLNETRRIYGKPMIINSGHRCVKHNALVGSTTENHILGKAVDVKCTDAQERQAMVYAALKAEMPGVGIHNSFIHLDNNRIYHALWIYTG